MQMVRLLFALCAAFVFTACGGAPSDGPINSFADLEGKKIGVKAGSVSGILLPEKVKNPQIKEFSSFADLLLAMESGAIDAVSTDISFVRGFMRKFKGYGLLEERLSRDQYGIALQKDSPFKAGIDSVLLLMQSEGVIDDFSKKWLDVDINETPDAPQQDWPGNNGTWVVATSGAAPPFDFYKNNKLAGYSIAVVLEIARRLDRKVEFVTMDFTGFIPALVSQKVDMCISDISITEERQKLVNFSRPIFNNECVVLVKRPEASANAGQSSDRQIRTLADLEGKRIGVQTGTIHDALVSNKIKNAEKSYFPMEPDLFLALKKGSVDAIAYDEPSMIPWLKREPDAFMKLEELLDEDSYAVALPKNSAYTKGVDSALQALKEEGTIQNFLDKWLNYNDDTDVIPMDWPGNNGTLVVATSCMQPPFSFYKKNKLSGFEIDIVLSIAKKLDKRVEFLSMDFSAILPALASHKVDMAIAGISITGERKNLVDFSIPYYRNSVVVVVKRLSPLDVGEAGKQAGFVENLKASVQRTFIHEERWKMVASGLWKTIYISVCSGFFGILLGFAICMVRRSRKAPMAVSSACFIRIIQGMPVLVLLMILYYIVFGHTSLSGEVVSIIAFSINFGVYASEIIRSGMDAVDVGQLEASAALGYSGRQTFFKILLPQAAVRFIPVLKGEFISMVKMTSIVGYVAVLDLTKVSDIIRSRTMEAFFPLIATAILYFIIANVLTGVLSYCEKKTNPKRRLRKINGVN